MPLSSETAIALLFYQINQCYPKYFSNPPIKIAKSWLPRGAMDLNCTGQEAVDEIIVLAPSWSHGSKSELFCQYARSGRRWLPRGAMDLNQNRKKENWISLRWLPRGAMDLNVPAAPVSPFAPGWLPRGAMDLNSSTFYHPSSSGVGSLVEPWI